MKSFKTFNLIPKFEKKRIILGFLKQKSLKQKSLKQKSLKQKSLKQKEIFQEEEKKILNDNLSLSQEAIITKEKYDKTMIDIFYKDRHIISFVKSPFQKTQEVLSLDIEEVEEILQKKQDTRKALLDTINHPLGYVMGFVLAVCFFR